MQSDLWMNWVKAEGTQREVPGPKSNPRIMEYRQIAGIALGGEDGAVPWCKIFINAAMVEAGLPIRKSAMARDIESDPDFVELDGPAYGAIVCFKRGTGGSGHIGFYLGESADGSMIRVLGGNQGDALKASWFPKRGPNNWAFTGYFWPASVEDPEGGRIVLDDDGEPAEGSVV